MKYRLLAILRCPNCGGRLSLTVTNNRDGEIRTGKMRCTVCPAVYPIVRYIPRFVSSDKYVRSFSAEWLMFARTQLDSSGKIDQSSRETFIQKTGFDTSDLEGRRILEAGCGMGRFLEVVSKVRTADVVGLDLSYAVESAFANVGRRRNVNIIQADIMHPPFAPGSFDIVYSIGVLHHTPNPKQALERLTQTIREGGEMAIWVYPKYDWTVFSDIYRHVTSRLPWNMLLGLTKAMLLIHAMDRRLPKRVKKRLDLILPISIEPRYEARLLDTFDWYSPKYQFKSTDDEVLSWFKDDAFTDVRGLEPPVAVRARKL